MATYRNFYPQFWEDDFILDLKKDEKYLYFYLLTNPKTNLWGIYEISLKVMEFHLDMKSDQILKLIDRLQLSDKIIYSKETNEIVIRNWLKYNFNPSPLVVKNIENGLKTIKNQNLIQYLYGIDTLSIQYQYPINTLSIPRDTVIESLKSLSSLKEKDLKEDIKEYSSLKDLYIGVIEFWNIKAENTKIPKVLKLTEKRKSNIKMRFEELPQSEKEDDGLLKIIEKAFKSDFLTNGLNDNKWTMTFDWVFESPNNFLKVYEGNYDNKSGKSGSKAGTYEENIKCGLGTIL